MPRIKGEFHISESFNIDIIGDIHAHAEQLKALLQKLGYKKKNGAYRHSDRTALFIGDYINRGSANFEVVDIVRSMVDEGSARAIMGNHEYNALGYHTKNPETGEYLRPHHNRNKKRHKTFLDEMDRDPQKAQEALSWFKTLPLGLKIGPAHFIHACWEHDVVRKTRDLLGHDMILDDEFLVNSVDKSHQAYETIEILLKGPEINLEDYGVQRYDEFGELWSMVRVAWWPTPRRLIEDVVVSVFEPMDYPKVDMTNEKFANADVKSDELVFFGHYWMSGTPRILASNIACVDYSIAKAGSLACYRWDGEKKLDSSKFLYVS